MKAVVKEKILKNRFILFLYAFSTFSFVFIHYFNIIGWDFAVYVLNAKYFFDNGFYFELLRPPLTPILIGLFSIFGWLNAEYIYIIFVSTFYLFSCLKLCEVLNIDKKLFYALSLNPVLIFFGLLEGTELISLALLQFFIYFILKKDSLKSGLSLGLMSLIRYSNFVYFPLILFTKNLKKILISVLIFIIVFSPWLLFNFYETGSPLTSIADHYALNIKYRDYLFTFFKAEDFLLVTNYLLPFFIIGLWFKFKGKFESKDWIMLFIFFFTLFLYIRTPSKTPRYLFSLILPLVYFSLPVIERLKIRAEYIGFLNIFIVMLLFLFPNPFFTPSNPLDYKIETNCMTSSNRWAYLNYFGIPSEPPPREWKVNEYINKGYRIVLYKYEKELNYATNETFLKSFPIIKETEKYIILGNESLCLPPYTFNKTYIQQLNEIFYPEYIETDPCKILFPEFVCNIF